MAEFTVKSLAIIYEEKSLLGLLKGAWLQSNKEKKTEVIWKGSGNKSK